MTTHADQPLTEQLQRGREEIVDVGHEVRSILDDLRVLAQKEAELARAEVDEQVGLTKSTGIWGGAAALFALVTFHFAAVALLLALQTFMPWWAAGVVTFGVVLAITAFCAAMAYSAIKRFSILPKRTIESISEDLRWARTRMNFNAR